jgi:hypothetical protein
VPAKIDRLPQLQVALDVAAASAVEAEALWFSDQRISTGY